MGGGGDGGGGKGDGGGGEGEGEGEKSDSPGGEGPGAAKSTGNHCSGMALKPDWRVVEIGPSDPTRPGWSSSASPFATLGFVDVFQPYGVWDKVLWGATDEESSPQEKEVSSPTRY